MYSLADLGITAANYNFSTLAAGGTFTASATAAPTPVTVDDTDSQDTIFNDGAPGSFGAAPTQQLLTGNVDGTVFAGVPSNPENEFEVTDSNGVVVGFIYDLHDSNSAAFSSLQGYVSTFELVPGETYTVTRTTGLPTADYSTFITCYTHNTRILTDKGQVPIQDLTTGDLVFTLDHGLQPIRWIGATTVSGMGEFAPVRITKGALGNDRALLVSPLHRMLVSGWRAELIFGEREVLVAARDLVNGDSVYVEKAHEVRYMHMLFDRHEIVLAEGCPSESFLPTALSLAAQDSKQRDEIYKLFPELAAPSGEEIAAARKSLRVYEANVLGRI